MPTRPEEDDAAPLIEGQFEIRDHLILWELAGYFTVAPESEAISAPRPSAGGSDLD